jgi:hypothetical protein
MPDELNHQAMEALVKANKVRMLKAEDKRLIRHGRLSPLAVLERPPDHWRNAKVVELLLAMPYVGRRRAAKWLEMVDVLPTKRLGDMTQLKRHSLAGFIAYANKERPPLSQRRP